MLGWDPPDQFKPAGQVNDVHGVHSASGQVSGVPSDLFDGTLQDFLDRFVQHRCRTGKMAETGSYRQHSVGYENLSRFCFGDVFDAIRVGVRQRWIIPTQKPRTS